MMDVNMASVCVIQEHISSTPEGSVEKVYRISLIMCNTRRQNIKKGSSTSMNKGP